MQQLRSLNTERQILPNDAVMMQRFLGGGREPATGCVNGAGGSYRENNDAGVGCQASSWLIFSGMAFADTQPQLLDAASRKLAEELSRRVAAGIGTALTPALQSSIQDLADSVGASVAEVVPHLIATGALTGGGGGSTDAGDLTTGLVALARGGTHADLSLTGGAGYVLKQSTPGADISVGTLSASDVGAAAAAHVHAAGDITSGTLDAARLPATAVVTGGSYADPSWITSLAATKLTGTIDAARLPATVPLTGGSYSDPSWIASLAASKITGILGVLHGGTGADLSGTGGAHQFLRQSGTGAVVTVAAIDGTDLSGVSGAGLAGITAVAATSGPATWDSSSQLLLWSGYLDATDYPSGRDLTFEVAAIVTRTGLSGSVVLVNVTDATTTSTATITSDMNPDAVAAVSVTLTGRKWYEIRCSLDSGYSAAPDAIQVLSASIGVR